LCNSKQHKLKKQKGRNQESEKNKKENLIKLKEIIQVERKRQYAVKSDPDNISYSAKYLITLHVPRISP